MFIRSLECNDSLEGTRVQRFIYDETFDSFNNIHPEFGNRHLNTLYVCPGTILKNGILSNGNFTLCACRDIREEMIIGNINEMSLKEIIECPQYKKAHLDFIKNISQDACKKCNKFNRNFDILESSRERILLSFRNTIKFK